MDISIIDSSLVIVTSKAHVEENMEAPSFKNELEDKELLANNETKISKKKGHLKNEEILNMIIWFFLTSYMNETKFNDLFWK